MNEEIRQLCEKAGIEKEEIREIDVAANCTMMHMLIGVDARSIGRAPYQPAFTEAKTMRAREIGLTAGEETIVSVCRRFPPISGRILWQESVWCGLQEEPGRVLFIDIGTNGEIVLVSNGRI